MVAYLSPSAQSDSNSSARKRQLSTREKVVSASRVGATHFSSPMPSSARSRSSTLIFQPDEPTGSSPALPSIAVDDMTDEPMDMSPRPLVPERPIMAHTARPPTELMQE